MDIQICRDLSVHNFLRVFQMHVHQFGIPRRVVSDSGSSIIASANIITDYLKDVITRVFAITRHRRGDFYTVF